MSEHQMLEVIVGLSLACLFGMCIGYLLAAASEAARVRMYVAEEMARLNVPPIGRDLDLQLGIGVHSFASADAREDFDLRR